MAREGGRRTIKFHWGVIGTPVQRHSTHCPRRRHPHLLVQLAGALRERPHEPVREPHAVRRHDGHGPRRPDHHRRPRCPWWSVKHRSAGTAIRETIGVNHRPTLPHPNDASPGMQPFLWSHSTSDNPFMTRPTTALTLFMRNCKREVSMKKCLEMEHHCIYRVLDGAC